MAPKRRLASDEELAKRAERKRIRTSYRTDATDKQKNKALRVAFDKIPGKKYSWMNQEKMTPAKTMGKEMAEACEISNGPIAKELGIGKYSKAATMFAKEYQEALDEGLTPEEAELRVEVMYDEHEAKAQRLSEEEMEGLLEEWSKEPQAQAQNPDSGDIDPVKIAEMEAFLAEPDDSNIDPAKIAEMERFLAESEDDDIDPDQIAEMEKFLGAPETPAAAEAPGQLPTPGPSPAVVTSIEKPSGLEAAKKPDEGTKENPISLSSRESSPIVISSREATPQAPPKKRKATKPPKAPKEKRPAKKARVAEPQKVEEEEEYDEEEEKQDLAALFQHVMNVLLV
ncbi:hypothetical protein F5Y13DRAFT_190411 [Hypoxylon sp. FL1857]|nr:hypothetical protein F5Y13DRAFT_190411 [Hypoxylon sp. FL1857]